LEDRREIIEFHEKCKNLEDVNDQLLDQVCPMFQNILSSLVRAMGLYHPPDGITNLKYKLYFLTPIKKKFQRERH
jgi:hypothetical protein